VSTRHARAIRKDVQFRRLPGTLQQQIAQSLARGGGQGNPYDPARVIRLTPLNETFLDQAVEAAEYREQWQLAPFGQIVERDAVAGGFADEDF
jgi:hypothetical protein